MKPEVKAILLATIFLVGSSRLEAEHQVSSGDAGLSDSLRQHFPNVSLLTQDNVPVRFYDDMLQGKVVLIQLMLTNCEKLCPVTTPRLARVQRELKNKVGNKVNIISLTIDPERDTPAAMKRYAQEFNTKKGWYFLTGKKADIDLIRRKLGLYDAADSEDRFKHMNVLTIGNESTGQWLALPALTNTAEITRTVLRLLGPQGESPR
jgi:protein SCO1/2